MKHIVAAAIIAFGMTGMALLVVSLISNLLGHHDVGSLPQ